MIIQKELTHNPFGHGDLHALLTRVYSKLAQGHFLQLLHRSENVILQTIYVLTDPFLTVQYLLQPFLSCEKGLTSSLKHPKVKLTKL